MNFLTKIKSSIRKLINMLKRNEASNPIQTDQHALRFVALAKESIWLSSFATYCWDAVAKQRINDRILSGLLGRHQDMYVRTTIMELAKIYDSQSASMTYRNVMKYIDKNKQSESDKMSIKEIEKITKNIQQDIKHIQRARNKYFAHHDAIRKNRNKQSEFTIPSIATLETVTKSSRDIVERISRLAGEDISIIIDTPKEVVRFEKLIKAQLL